MSKQVNYDTRKFAVVADRKHKVDEMEIVRNGHTFKTFGSDKYGGGEVWINIENGLAMRLYSTSERQLSNPPIIASIQNLMNRIKTVKDKQGNVIYKRKHSKEPFYKAKVIKKNKIRVNIS